MVSSATVCWRDLRKNGLGSSSADVLAWGAAVYASKCSAIFHLENRLSIYTYCLKLQAINDGFSNGFCY